MDAASPIGATLEPDAVARDLAALACRAGAVLLAHAQGACPHRLKADGSPTSAADLAAEELIIAELAVRYPGIPVIAEETASEAPRAARFFLVDPLDGTRDFLHGGREYCACLALIEGERPVAGALAAPALGRVWWAGRTAWEAAIGPDGPGPARAIAVRARPAVGVTALVSSRHGDAETEACLARLPIADRRKASSAVKFGLIASGEADLYVRCGPTMEWDTAAGDHILTAAGGRVVGPDGTTVTYGHETRGYRNGAFAALGDPALARGLALAQA
jgi:3'(2'), 5'-bisphosphate nucleotidase